MNLFEALPAQAGVAECGQVVEQGDGLILARAGFVLAVVVLDAVEQRAQRDLDGVEVSGFILRAFLYLRYKLGVLPPVA